MATRANKHRPNEYLYDEIRLITTDRNEFTKRFGKSKNFWEISEPINKDHEYTRLDDSTEDLPLYQLQLFCNSVRKLLNVSKSQEKILYDFWYEKVGNVYKLIPNKLPKVFYNLKINKYNLPYGDNLLLALLKSYYPSQTKGKTDLEIKQMFKNGILKFDETTKEQITALEYQTIIEHSFYAWHKMSFPDFHQTKFSQPLGANTNWTDIDTSHHQIYIDAKGGPKKEVYPVINVVFEEAKDKDTAWIKGYAKNLLNSYIGRNVNVKEENIHITQGIIRAGLNQRKYLVSFSFFEVYNTSDELIIYKENYDMLRIAVNYMQKYKITLKKSDNKSTLDTFDKKVVLTNDSLRLLASSENLIDHYFVNPDKLHQEQQKFGISSDLLSIQQKYDLRLEDLSNSFSSMAEFLQLNYKTNRQISKFYEKFPKEIVENISFYFDDVFNLVGVGSKIPEDANTIPTEKLEFPEQDHGIAFGFENVVWHPMANTSIDTTNELSKYSSVLMGVSKDLNYYPIEEELLFVPENLVVDFNLKFDDITGKVSSALKGKITDSAIKKITNKNTFFGKEFEKTHALNTNNVGVAEIMFTPIFNDGMKDFKFYPFIRNKTINCFFYKNEELKNRINLSAKKKKAFTWSQFINEFHYPELKMSQKKTDSPTSPKDKSPQVPGGIDPPEITPPNIPGMSETPGKEYSGCLEGLSNPNIPGYFLPRSPIGSLSLIDAVEVAANLSLPKSPYTCFDNLLDIRSVDDFYDFFFHKFPWYEFMSRRMVYYRNALINSNINPALKEVLGESLQCLIDADITRLYCTFLNLKDLYINCNEYFKAGLMYIIPTLPRLEYINILDIWKDIRRELILALENFVIEFAEGILSISMKDLMTKCNVEAAFCNFGFTPNDNLITKSDEIKNKYPLKNIQNNNKMITFQDMGDSKLSVNSINIFDILLNQNKQLILTLISNKFNLNKNHVSKLFDTMTYMIDIIELYSLLNGSSPISVYNIIKIIAEEIDPTFGEFFSIQHRTKVFFLEVALYCNKEILVEIINQSGVMFEAEPCAPENVVGNHNYVDDMMKTLVEDEGKTEEEAQEYLVEQINTMTTNIQSICGLFGTKIYDLSNQTTQLISRPSAKLLENYCDGIKDIIYKLKKNDTKTTIIEWYLEGGKLVSKSSEIKISFDIIDDFNVFDQSELKQVFDGQDYEVAIYNKKKGDYIFFTKEKVVKYPEKVVIADKGVSSKKLEIDKFISDLNDHSSVVKIPTGKNPFQEIIFDINVEDAVSSLRKNTFFALLNQTIADEDQISLKKDFIKQYSEYEKTGKKWTLYTQELQEGLSKASSNSDTTNIKAMLKQIEELKGK